MKFANGKEKEIKGKRKSGTQYLGRKPPQPAHPSTAQPSPRINAPTTEARSPVTDHERTSVYVVNCRMGPPVGLISFYSAVSLVPMTGGATLAGTFSPRTSRADATGLHSSRGLCCVSLSSVGPSWRIYAYMMGWHPLGRSRHAPYHRVKPSPRTKHL